MNTLVAVYCAKKGGDGAILANWPICEANVSTVMLPESVHPSEATLRVPSRVAAPVMARVSDAAWVQAPVAGPSVSVSAPVEVWVNVPETFDVAVEDADVGAILPLLVRSPKSKCPVFAAIAAPWALVSGMPSKLAPAPATLVMPPRF